MKGFYINNDNYIVFAGNRKKADPVILTWVPWDGAELPEDLRDGDFFIHKFLDGKIIKNKDYTDDKALNKYKDDRKKEYPSTGDQLDMIYWDMVNSTTTFIDKITGIKVKYPKP